MREGMKTRESGSISPREMHRATTDRSDRQYLAITKYEFTFNNCGKHRRTRRVATGGWAQRDMVARSFVGSFVGRLVGRFVRRFVRWFVRFLAYFG